MFKLEFSTSNAAFDDENGTIEIARILRDIADDFEAGRNGRDMTGKAKIRDVNGNTIGKWSCQPEFSRIVATASELSFCGEKNGLRLGMDSV